MTEFDRSWVVVPFRDRIPFVVIVVEFESFE